MFALKIIRKATGQAIFDTNLPGLIFSEQFVQLPVRNPLAPQYIIFQIRLPAENLYMELGKTSSMSLGTTSALGR